MSRTIQGSSTVGIRLTLASDNPVTVLPTGAIDTTGLYAVYGSDAVAWSLINRGKLSGGHNGVTFAGTGTITNGNAAATHASISGGDDGIIITGSAATVVNDGTITGKSATSVGVYLADGGRVTNGAPGITAATISGGRYGVEIAGASGTIVNRGRISGGADGVDTVLVKGGAGTVVNYGTISWSTSVGIALYEGGSITNSSMGTITSRGLAINVGGSTSSTVTNHGLIIGVRGVYMSGNGGTAINAGTIISSHLEAFSGERMIIDPGAVFAGKVRANVLELAKGATPGTLGLLGARYLDRTLGGTHTVGTIVVDAGAQWTLAGYNTLTSGATLTATGILTNAGVLRGQGVLVDNGKLVNAGTTGPLIQLTLNADSYLLNQETGTILGSVDEAAGTSRLTNLGLIHDTRATSPAVRLHNGGTVTNGSADDTSASIIGYGPIDVSSEPATITNFGTITSLDWDPHNLQGVDVRLGNGGRITNGNEVDRTALIGGGQIGILSNSGIASVANFGTITGGRYGIEFGPPSGTCDIINGSETDNTALIYGYWWGVQFFARFSTSSEASLTLTNFGTIVSDFTGVDLWVGGTNTIVNGSERDTIASISGRSAIVVRDGDATISNFGTIKGEVDNYYKGKVTLANGSESDTKALISGAIHFLQSTVSNFGTIVGGVYSQHDSRITNGSKTDRTATISSSSSGISAAGTLTVNNFATVMGSTEGVYNPLGSGTVINGSPSDTSARIFGGSSAIEFHSVNLTNFGTIESDKSGLLQHDVVGSEAHLTVANGSVSDTSARISGGVVGIEAVGATKITNFGTIAGKVDGIHGGFFVSIVNGSAADTKALIAADTPLSFPFGLSSVVNFGSIISSVGNAGTAISFGKLYYGAGDNRLVVEPGAVFVGKVTAAGTGNILELAQGISVGSIGGIGSQFAGFDTMTIDTGAKWMLTGSNDAGMVTNDGSLSIAAGGTLDVTASVDPLSNGLFQINANSLLEIAANTGAADRMKFLGAGKLTIDAAAQFGAHVGTTTYAGPLIESFVNGDKIDLKDVLLPVAVLNYTSATGLLHITQGGAGVATLAFETSSLGAGSFHAANDGTGHLLLTHSQ